MADKTIEKCAVSADVNPLLVAIVMNTLSEYLPIIKSKFDDRAEVYIQGVDFDTFGLTIEEIYYSCYAETVFMTNAKQMFNDRGKFPDIQELIQAHAMKGFRIAYPDKTTSVRLEIAPAYGLLAAFQIRCHFEQLCKMMNENLSEFIILDFSAIQKSVDVIYEKCLGQSTVREEIALEKEIFNLTGQLPNDFIN